MIMKMKRIALITTLLCSTSAMAEISTDVGTANIDLRLRYEAVDQDNALKDAKGLILRTTANFKTIKKQGFYGFVEVENSYALIDDYNNTNGEGIGYSVIADPESTEVDQAYVGYKMNGVSLKLGRQVLTFDNHRFVGHVGWRNDKQTFDAFSASYTTSNKIKLSYAFINRRNRIFADEKDLESHDHLINASVPLPAGKLSAYAYALEVDNNTANSLDTFGIRYAGKSDQFVYATELATQSNELNGVSHNTNYMLFEGGIKLDAVTIKAGYESLGSDDGVKSFATPLATLHKFNGWADQFLATPNEGLDDAYVKVTGKMGKGKWLVAYHSYSANKPSETIDDLGSEVNLQYVTKIAKFPIGVRYANYSAGDVKVDTNKLWLWTGYKF
jgi:hypothetical protein